MGQVDGATSGGAERLVEELTLVAGADDDRSSFDADEGSVFEEERVGEAVVGGDRHLSAGCRQLGELFAQPIGELLGGLVGEGEPDGSFRGQSLGDGGGEAEDDRGGLAGARAGGHSQRRGAVPDDGELFGGEIVESDHDAKASRPSGRAGQTRATAQCRQ